MLRAIALFSGLCDLVAGALLLFAAGSLASHFGVPRAVPPIFSDLNALFLIAVGLGYYLPWRDPHAYRGYLWVMGVFLKSAGAVAFILAYALDGAPRSFLLFAASDAGLAAVTLAGLMRERSPRRS